MSDRECAINITPLLYTNIYRTWNGITLATDASSTGNGVVYTNDISNQSDVISSPYVMGQVPPSGISALVHSVRWKTCISHRWRDSEHINSLEIRSVLSGIRWLLKRPESFIHQRLLIFSDSTATVGALNKGRSSSYSMLSPIRAITSLLLASGIGFTLRWIPSEMNPADQPSRN